MGGEGKKYLVVALLILLGFLFVGNSFCSPLASRVFSVGPGASSAEPLPSQYLTSSLNHAFSGMYWYVGAYSNDTSSMSNQGVRTQIQVRDQQVHSAFLAFWIGDTMSNNLWGQVGYYIYNDAKPAAFYQVWNLTTRTEITSGSSGVSLGSHIFSMSLQKGSVWTFKVDSSSMGSYDMRTTVSSAKDPVYALSEEGYASSTFVFTPVSFLSAMEILKNGQWNAPASALSYGNSWPVQGAAQNSTIAPNEIIVGGNHDSLLGGTLVWSSE